MKLAVIMQLDATLLKSHPSAWTASSTYLSVKHCIISKREHSGRKCLYSREVQQPLNWYLNLQSKALISKYDPCSHYHLVCKLSARHKSMLHVCQMEETQHSFS